MREPCPRCGGELRLLSGFQVCVACGHRMDSQYPCQSWATFDSELGRHRARSSDAQTRPERRYNPKRRLPLA